MRKKNVFICVVIGVLLISCSKSTTEPESNQIYRLSKLSDVLGGWEWNYNYDEFGHLQYPSDFGIDLIYNNDNLLVKKIDIEDQDTTSYSYSGTNLIQIKESNITVNFEYSDNLLIRSTRHHDDWVWFCVNEYYYDNSNNIVQVLGAEDSDEFDFKQIYNYDDGILTNSAIFWLQNDEWIEVAEKIYEFENDLLVSVQSIWDIEIANGDEGFLQTFEYDENGNCISRSCYYSEDGVLSEVPDWINEYEYELVDEMNSAFDYFDYIKILEAGHIFISPIYYE